MALCEPNPERFAEIEAFLAHYGLQVTAFNDVDSVLSEIEARRYSTHRVYLAILIDYHLAQAVEQAWQKVTHDNPTILQTPVVLMREASDVESAQSLINKGYFRFQLTQPVAPTAMLRLLNRLNRWKRWQKELSQPPRPSVKIGS
ncbi:MAG: hypothetical protein ACP5D0_05595 [Hydrogenovibrio sp.]